MPKIKVNEQDLSWYYRQRAISGLTVFMPLIATWGPTDRPVLTDDSNFEKVFGTEPAFREDLSYVMAKSFIKSGFNVLGWRLPTRSMPEDELLCAAYGSYIPENRKGEEPVTYTPSSKFVAKYPGTFGNDLSIEILKLSDYLARINVFYKESLIDTIYYDFKDVTSPNYFLNTNRNSQYVSLKKYDATTETLDDDISSFADKKCNEALMPTPVIPGGAPIPIPEDGVSFDLANGGNGLNPFEYNEEDAYDAFEEWLYDLGVGASGTITKGSFFDICHQELVDPLAYDFDIICSAGFGINPNAKVEEPVNNPGVFDKFLTNLANNRKDVVFLVDGLKKFNSDQMYQYCGNAVFDTSYASGYGPWSYSYVSADGSLRLMPGSYVMLTRWGQALAAGAPAYLAPAGVKRADVGNIVQETAYPVGSAIIDLWQNHENTTSTIYNYKVNPIAKLKQYGYVIYGNSTLLHDKNGQTSMLQSFSTRVVANFIKKRALDISLTLQFDQMGEGIFAEFKTLMSTYLDTLKYGSALYDYKVIIDRSELTLDNLNARTIPVRILISPNPAAENFIINLEISQAGVVFGDDTTDNEEA